MKRSYCLSANLRRAFLIATLPIVVATVPLTGCGGGGGGSNSTYSPAPVEETTRAIVTIDWPARTRSVKPRGRDVTAPSSAQSATIQVTPAYGGATATWNDPRSANNLAAYSDVQTAPIGQESPASVPLTITVTFYAEASAPGATIVGTATTQATLDLDGTGVGTIDVAGTVTQVVVPPSQSVTVGHAANLTFTALDANGNAVPVSPGSATWAIASGANYLSVTPDGIATGLATGSATVTASVDGMTSSTQTLNVVAPTSVGVTISPTTATVTAGATQMFTDAVTGSSNTAVTWSLQEGAAGGSVTAGVYTAPATPGTYHIIATSQADSTKTATATVTVTAAASSGTALYTATDIGSPRANYKLSAINDLSLVDTKSTADLNDSGQVASTWEDGVRNYAFLFTPGAGFKDVGTLGGTLGAGAIAVSSNGVVAGTSETTSVAEHAAIYSGSTPNDLGTLSTGTNSYSEAINSQGQVVGESNLLRNGGSHAFLYSGGMKDLGTLSSDGTSGSSFAKAINSQGQVVGYCETDESSRLDRAFLYSNGKMQDLGSLNGDQYTYSFAQGINDSSQVVGFSQVTVNGEIYVHPFLWSNGVMQDLDTLDGFSSDDGKASSINNSGQVVGTETFASDNSSGRVYGGFVYPNGPLLNLNDVTVGLNGVTLSSALKINNGGQILAYGLDSAGTSHLVVLTPISAETRAKHPVRVGPHARGVSQDRLPKQSTGQPLARTIR